jgi:DNA polymerase-1
VTRTLLIDADSFVYEAARANEVEVQWDDCLWTLHSELPPSIAHLDDRLHQLQEKLEADRVVLALSDYKDPWRKRVMPSYKANRKDTRKPVVYGPLREYLHETYDTYQKPGLEGDDVLGILLTHPKLIQGEKLLVSLDKDMKTLPGEHYNFQKDVRFTVNVADADYFHIRQTLIGDPTDGYPGCPGVGPVSADKILSPFKFGVWDGNESQVGSIFDLKGAWGAVVRQYAKKGLGEAVALMNARVARICRYTDYDYDKKEVKLWHP